MPGTRFTERISSVKSAVEHVRNPLESDFPFHSNLYYQQVVDLRKIADVDAVVHFNARKTGTHKIQVIEAGRKCSGQIAEVISEIVDEHPELQAVSRVDSCVDVVNGPEVKWIAQSVRARSAQWQAQFGSVEIRDEANRKMQWSEMGKREVKTMYIGKRPNCFRVYDKLAERYRAYCVEKQRHERLAAKVVLDKIIEPDEFERESWQLRYPDLKSWRRDYENKLKPSARHYMPFPDFASWFAEQCQGPLASLIKNSRSNVVQMPLPGQEQAEQLSFVPELPRILTRVERQMGAGRIPDELNSFEKIFSKHALEFNPFTRLDFSPYSAQTEISAADYTPLELLAGMKMRELLETGMTYQQLFAFLNGKRNAHKIVKKFSPFIAAANPSNVVSISSSELYERYRDSLTRQMAA